MHVISSGNEANRSGQWLEQVVEDEFKSRGVPVFAYSEKGNNGDLLADRFLLTGVPYTSIYGATARSEFVFRDFRIEDIRIECKWQQVPGSVDEKWPYLFMNATRCMEEREIWFLIDGGGARASGIRWLKAECSQVASKRLRVMSIPEFKMRAKDLLRDK